jgi:hypothetical protein
MLNPTSPGSEVSNFPQKQGNKKAVLFSRFHGIAGILPFGKPIREKVYPFISP